MIYPVKQSTLIWAIATMLGTDSHIEYRASSRSAIDLGYEPTSKKRVAHRQRKAAERRKAAQVIRKAHKDRNKKGRP